MPIFVSIIFILIFNLTTVTSKSSCKIYYPDHTFSSVPPKNLNEFNISHENAIQIKNSENVTTLSEEMLNRHHSLTTVWLIYLDLSSDNIESIEANTFSNISDCLQYLLLDNNKLTNITENVFKDLFELRVLDLSFNKISSLSIDAFVDLYNLDKLLLHNNLLKSVPSMIWNGVQNLTFLDLSTNELELNSNMFQKLEKLIHLNLQNNSIMNIVPNAFVGLSNLKSLRLDCNILQNFKFQYLNGLTSLKELNISNSADVMSLNEDIKGSLKLSNHFTLILTSFTIDLKFNKSVLLSISKVINESSDTNVSKKNKIIKTSSKINNKTDKYINDKNGFLTTTSTITTTTTTTAFPFKLYENTIEKHINMSNKLLNETKTQTNILNEKIFDVLSKVIFLLFTELVIIVLAVIIIIFLVLKRRNMLGNCKQTNIQESERNLITSEENLNIEL